MTFRSEPPRSTVCVLPDRGEACWRCSRRESRWWYRCLCHSTPRTLLQCCCLLLVVDRSLVYTVRDYSTYDSTVNTFKLEFFVDENKNMSFLSDRSLAGIHTRSKRQPGTIGSHPGIGIHPYIYNSDNPGTKTDIIRGLIPPCTVWKSQPHRPI